MPEYSSTTGMTIEDSYTVVFIKMDGVIEVLSEGESRNGKEI